MAEKDVEVPEDRCGFELPPEDDGIERWRWDVLTSAICCWRPVWKNHEDTERCIWHADANEKPIAELITARADAPERLDGAILRRLHGEGEPFSLRGYSLLGARIEMSLQNVDFTDTVLRRANLTDADLRDADFVDTDLREANLTDANLQGADFTDADLLWADFTDADLREADFTDTDFTDSDPDHPYSKFVGDDFTRADLPEADFTDTDLEGAIFSDADLQIANFTDAFLQNADFTDVVLQGADFTDADLQKADFIEADLHIANFTNADLPKADLSDADAKEANFQHANLQDAVFTRTDCREATFTSALLYETVFADTRINSQTTFFDPKTSFYDSITSRPACVYEENPLTTNHLPEDEYTGNHLMKNVHPLEAARWVYRRLETLHEENALSEAAREFHLSKEEAERSLYWERCEYGPWAVKTLMWYLTRHGESVKRVLTWWGIVILTAGLLFAGFDGVQDADGTVYAITSLGELGTITGWQEILMNVYFSVTTFSTIMDGGLAPAGTGTRAVVAVESIIGALLVAFLIFILGRRTAR